MANVKVFPEKYKYVFQSVVVFAVTMYNVGSAISVAWASPSLPKLLAPGGPLQITVDQGTWIVSSMKVGQFIMPIPAAWMMHKFGHKRSLLCGSFILLCGRIMLALTNTFELICVYSFLAGTAFSFAYVVLPMYIAEISSDYIRGYLGILLAVAAKTGLLFMYAIGPFVSVRLMAWLSTIPICMFLAIYYWLPDSPYFLLGIDNPEAAEMSLQKLRCTLDVKEELEQMEASVKQSQENKGTFRELFFDSRNRRNIIIVLGLSALVELCGSHTVMLYAQTIFATIDTDLEPEYASIIFGVVQLTAAIVACFLVDTIGRRPLMLISIVGAGSCTMLIGVYYILERHTDVTGLGWLPVTALMLFMASYTIGILPLLTVITSELFPKHLKGVAGATKSINMAWIGLALVSAYQNGVDNWGSEYVFIGFSLVTFAFIPFIVFMLPETKRQSLETILDGKVNHMESKL